MLWAWMLWSQSPYALGTRTELWFRRRCSGHRMLLERVRNYGLGMDALVTCMLSEHERNYGLMCWRFVSGDSVQPCGRAGALTRDAAGLSTNCPPWLKLFRAKLGHGQLHFAVLGAQLRELRASVGPKNAGNAGLRNVSDTPVCAPRRLVGGLSPKPLTLTMLLWAG